MRTALTTLGIIIGVAAVIVMVAIGTGAQRVDREADPAAPARTSSWSSPGSAASGRVRQGQRRRRPRSRPTMREAIRAEVPGVRYVSPALNTRTQVVAGSRQLEHAGPGRRAPISPRSAPGRCSSAASSPTQDVDARARKVAVLGIGRARPALRRRRRSDRRRSIRIKNLPFQVVGVLTSKGQAAMGQDQDDTVIVPVHDRAEEAAGRAARARTSRVSAADGVPLDDADATQIAALLRERHQHPAGRRRRLHCPHARGDGQRADVDHARR